MLYAVAYSALDGTDFGKGYPWCMPESSDIEDCKNDVQDLVSGGYSNVALFCIKRHQEEYSWNYIKAHKVVEAQ